MRTWARASYLHHLQYSDRPHYRLPAVAQHSYQLALHQLTDPSILRGPGDTDLLFISGSGAEGGDDELQDLTEDRDVEGQTGPKTGRLSWRELDINPN